MRNLPLAALVALALLASPMALAKAVEFGAESGVSPRAAAPPVAESRLEATSTLELAPALGALDQALAPVEAEAGALSGLLASPEVRLDLDAAGKASLEVTAQARAPAARESEPGWAESLSTGALAEAAVEAAPPVVATAGVLALLQAFGVWRWLGVGGFALYSRLTKSELLDNGHRDGVYKLIQERPGIGLSEIAEASGLGWGTTVYHLDRLERAGFVASERAGLHRCYFPVGLVPKEARKLLGALKADTTRSVAEFLVARPGATQTELCEALGLSASAASKQVSKLEGAGLVRREREWKTVHLFPDPALPSLLQGDSVEAPRPAMAPLPA